MRRIVLLACMFAAAAPSARAMQFKTVTLDRDLTVITATGPIIAGDVGRLVSAVAQLPRAARFAGYVIDSPGGNVAEAGRLAAGIRAAGGAAIVGNGAECVSACFLLFAAATRKIVIGDALIGVHSASAGGRETSMSLAVTAAMARAAAEYGVPPVILGKMIGTAPGRVDWLTPEDLRTMGTEIVAALPPAALLPGAPAPPPAVKRSRLPSSPRPARPGP